MPGEDLILAAAQDMCHELLGEAAANRTAHVPYSVTIVSQRTDGIAVDMRTQLLEQLDESP